jgi:hypothetical protein
MKVGGSQSSGVSSSVFCFAFCAMLVGLSYSAWAQPKKVHRIGYLGAGYPAFESIRAETIRLSLRELGYMEGDNIAIEYGYAEGKGDRLPELAAELVRLKVDIIVVAGGDGPIRAAKNATKTIPHRYVGPWTRSCRGRLH